jgi:hypothetical protein
VKQNAVQYFSDLTRVVLSHPKYINPSPRKQKKYGKVDYQIPIYGGILDMQCDDFSGKKITLLEETASRTLSVAESLDTPGCL